ncbi:MAG: response regulator [Candidatus Aminicenantes bacterium]|nr:response regulator [Candidatus Aminicenantes bacterium]
MSKTKKKILVVDDEINVCKSIRQAILSDDYDVDTALSGEEALEKDKESHFDLVISDLMMPGISGMDLLTSLKKERPEVCIIMVTGYPTIKTAVQSVKIGAFDYLPKPFTPNELRSLVQRAFKTIESEAGETASPPVMPPGLFSMKGHTWLRKGDKNVATVGIVYAFIQALEKISHLELPKENKNIFQGEVSARITDKDNNVHRVWSPATGKIIQVNHDLEKDPSLLKKDPYGKGWLFRIESPNLEMDLKGLTPSE